MKFFQPDYKLIYTDIINKKYPHKIENCKALLSRKHLSVKNILKLNQIIFDTSISSEQLNQRFKAYKKSDIINILGYQKENKLNNNQLANHFNLSRNTVAKWKKIFLVKNESRFQNLKK